MVTCEMCGNETSVLTSIKTAGSNMSVCNSCKNMGELVHKPKQTTHTFKRTKKNGESHYEVVNNYVSIIHSAMGKKGLNMTQLARATNIKESTLQNYLKETIKLDVDTARRIQKFLEIKIVYECSNEEDVNSDDFIVDDKNSGALSLGDLIKQQMNK